uniref:Protein quiver n=1 Tax=Trichuris muris TaxID=70415 RepID=A0A5S6Q9T5_TRIMR
MSTERPTGFGSILLLFQIIPVIHIQFANCDTVECVTCASAELRNYWHLTSFSRRIDDDYFTDKCDGEYGSSGRTETCSSLCVDMLLQAPLVGGTKKNLYARGCLGRLLSQKDLNEDYGSKCDDGDVFFFDHANQPTRTYAKVRYCKDQQECRKDSADDCKKALSSRSSDVSCYDCVNDINCVKESACTGRYCIKTRTYINDRETVIRTCSAINPAAPLKEFNATGSICTHYEGRRHIWTRSPSGNVLISTDHCYCTSDFCNGVRLPEPLSVPLFFVLGAILYCKFY